MGKQNKAPPLDAKAGLSGDETIGVERNLTNWKQGFFCRKHKILISEVDSGYLPLYCI